MLQIHGERRIWRNENTKISFFLNTQKNLGGDHQKIWVADPTTKKIPVSITTSTVHLTKPKNFQSPQKKGLYARMLAWSGSGKHGMFAQKGLERCWHGTMAPRNPYQIGTGVSAPNPDHNQMYLTVRYATGLRLRLTAAGFTCARLRVVRFLHFSFVCLLCWRTRTTKRLSFLVRRVCFGLAIDYSATFALLPWQVGSTLSWERTALSLFGI